MAQTPSLFYRGAVPNSLVRSALFTTKSLGEDRPMVKNKEIFAQSGYEIHYTGEELNQFDAQALYAVLQCQRDSGLPIGAAVTVSQASLISLLGLEPTGNTYKRIGAQLARLHSCSILIKYPVKSDRREYYGHIINDIWKDSRGHLTFVLNPNLASVFDADCTFISLQQKLSVEKLMSKWLLDYTTSHDSFFPLTVKYLKQLCGNSNATGQFTRQLREACDEITEKLGTSAPFVGYNLEKGRLTLYKKELRKQIEASKRKEGEEINPWD